MQKHWKGEAGPFCEGQENRVEDAAEYTRGLRMHQ